MSIENAYNPSIAEAVNKQIELARPEAEMTGMEALRVAEGTVKIDQGYSDEIKAKSSAERDIVSAEKEAADQAFFDRLKDPGQLDKLRKLSANDGRVQVSMQDVQDLQRLHNIFFSKASDVKFTNIVEVRAAIEIFANSNRS